MTAKCSMLGFSPGVNRVEAMESSRQPGIVSTVNPGLMGAPPPSTMQQLSILKPDEQAPTTCSTVVLGMGSDSARAKRDAKTMLVGLECTPTAVVVFPTTMPPHLPDQPRLLLNRPLPWPLWKVKDVGLAMFNFCQVIWKVFNGLYGWYHAHSPKNRVHGCYPCRLFL
jgi:hypothetical protein